MPSNESEETAATYLLNEQVVQSVDGCIFQDLLEVDAVDLDRLSLSLGLRLLRLGRRNEDLLSRHWEDAHSRSIVSCCARYANAQGEARTREWIEEIRYGQLTVSGSGMMLRVRDPPRVVRDENERVKHETDAIVDGLRGGEGAVSTCRTVSVPQSNVFLNEDLVDRRTSCRGETLASSSKCNRQ